MQKTKTKTTAIIATYNRAPYDYHSKKFKLNPLLWCLNSLLNQWPLLEEIIVVDDGSSEGNHTEEVVNYCRGGGVKIVLLKNKNNLGSAVSRNIGVMASNSKFTYLTDDDCICTHSCIFLAELVLEKLKNYDRNAVGLNLPVYNRATIPAKFIEICDIGKIDISSGVFNSTSDSFPIEYISNPRFIDEERNLLWPFQVQNINAHLLCETSVLKKTKFSVLPGNNINGYAEEAFFMQRVRAIGKKIFYWPDPRAHAVHMLYGLGGNSNLKGSDWLSGERLSLGEMVKESSVPRLNTGNRTDPESFEFAKKITLEKIFSDFSEGLVNNES